MSDDNEAQLAGLVGPCPTCHNGRLRGVTDGERTNFLCEECGSCWHPELAWVTRVEPTTCPGCPSVATCTAARRAHVPAAMDATVAATAWSRV